MPCPASHSASATVSASTPEKASSASVRCSSARQRTDLLETRIAVPPARRDRSARLASKASRSTHANGGSSVAQARSSRAWSDPRSDASDRADGDTGGMLLTSDMAVH